MFLYKADFTGHVAKGYKWYPNGTHQWLAPKGLTVEKAVLVSNLYMVKVPGRAFFRAYVTGVKGYFSSVDSLTRFFMENPDLESPLILPPHDRAAMALAKQVRDLVKTQAEQQKLIEQQAQQLRDQAAQQRAMQRKMEEVEQTRYTPPPCDSRHMGPSVSGSEFIARNRHIFGDPNWIHNVRVSGQYKYENWSDDPEYPGHW